MVDIERQLAGIFKVSEEKITTMRRKGSLYSLIDIAVMVTHNDVRYAAKEICILCRRFPEVWKNPQKQTCESGPDLST